MKRPQINIVPFRAIRLFDLALKVFTVGLAIGTIALVALVPSNLGSGGVGVTAAIGPRGEPIQDVRRVLADDVPLHMNSINVTTTVDVPRGQRDARVVIALAAALQLALAWIGLLAIRGVVGAARDGEPFARRNVLRLQCLGGAVLAAPVVGAVCNRLIDGALDAGAARLRLTDFDTVLLLGVSIGVFALAEVFRSGAELRELEANTI